MPRVVLTGPSHPITLLGLSLSNIVTTPHIQLELALAGSGTRAEDTGSAPARRRLELERVLDGLQERFGRDAITRASAKLGGRSVPDEFRDLAVPRDERSPPQDEVDGAPPVT